MRSEIVFSLFTKLIYFKRNCPLRTSGRGRSPSPPEPNCRYATDVIHWEFVPNGRAVDADLIINNGNEFMKF